MKSNEQLRQMSSEDISQEILSLRKEQMNLRFKHAAGALDKPHVVREVRRAIARAKTIQTQKAGNLNDKQ